MKLEMEAKRISTEFWLVTLTITEPHKENYQREFVVNEGQLAFLNVLSDMNR